MQKHLKNSKEENLMFNKKIAAVLAAVTAAFTLAACGAQDVSAPASVSTS